MLRMLPAGFRPSLVLLLTLAALAFPLRDAAAQLVPVDDSPYAAQRGAPSVIRWQVGAIVRANQGPVRGLGITIPVPTDWPDQTVKIDEESFSPHVANVDYRTIDGGVRQMLVSIPAIEPGDQAQASLILEITTYALTPPESTDELTIPRNPPRDVRRAVGSSPFINPRHRDFRKLAEELTADAENDWQKVERLYDWVRDNIEQSNEPMRGAEKTLDAKSGSTEDLVNVFVALCRSIKIPARIVWVTNHQYAEFYLEDPDGKGHWYPCQLAGDREFGGMSDARPILQRGDNFLVPEKREPYRFVPELVKGAAGGGRPSITFLRDRAAGN